MEMRQDIDRQLMDIEQDPSVRCVVLRGEGEHFMAGGDVKSFMDYARMPADERRTMFLARIHELHTIMFTIQRMSQPIIASVRGAAAGAGVSFALMCDMVIASEDAFFTLAYTAIGTSPDGSSTYFLPRAVGTKKAMEIALLGDRFTAQEALDMGLINRVVATDELIDETAKLAARLAQGPTRAYGNTKRLIRNSFDRSLEAQLQAEAEGFADSAMADDWVEGVTAFNEKRKPEFKGS
jgi:2-(1,2-epoxy-1,2-dihydrophenyl)acetyl-CoA isomerase